MLLILHNVRTVRQYREAFFGAFPKERTFLSLWQQKRIYRVEILLIIDYYDVLCQNNIATHIKHPIHESAFYFGKNAFPLSRVWEMCRNIRELRFSVRSLRSALF